MGTAQIISGLNAFLAANEYGESVTENILGEDVHEPPAPFFLITIAKDIWMQLDSEKRHALVDHELCHCGISGEKICMLPHDVEDFTAIVRRRGLWTPDLASLVKAAGGAQQSLDLDPKTEDSDKTPVASLKLETGGAPANGILSWAASLPGAGDVQTLPVNDGQPEDVYVLEVDSETYVALRDKLGEDAASNMFLNGVFGPDNLRCVVQNAEKGLRWPGLDAVGAPAKVKTTKPKKETKK